MALQKVRFGDIEHDVTPGTLLGVSYHVGAKVLRHVAVGVELKERVRHDEGWIWAGEIVKCSPVLEPIYLGAMIRLHPNTQVMVRG